MKPFIDAQPISQLQPQETENGCSPTRFLTCQGSLESPPTREFPIFLRRSVNVREVK